MSHSLSNNPGPASTQGGAGHQPPPPQGFPGSPNQPYPMHPPPYPGHYPPHPYPMSGPQYPYPPPDLRPPQVLPPLYMPPYPPPVPAPRSSLKPLWITLGVVISVLVVVCLGCSVLLAVSLARIASSTTGTTPVAAALYPVIAAQIFCAYETNKDYRSAYSQLSTHLQSQISAPQFESDNQARDATRGPVVGCSAARSTSDPLDQVTVSSPTTLTLNIWLGGPATNDAPPLGLSGNMTMVQEGTNWKVDSIDSALQLT